MENKYEWARVKNNLEELDCPELYSIHEELEGELIRIKKVIDVSDMHSSSDVEKEYFIENPFGKDTSFFGKELILITELEKKVIEYGDQI